MSSTNIWRDMINADNKMIAINRTSKVKKNNPTFLKTVEDVEIPLIEIRKNENLNQNKFKRII